MAYSDVAALTLDYDFSQRVSACAATEIQANPTPWVIENLWMVASAPGFGDAYASALAANVERPGNDQSVISDPMILSAVQGIIASQQSAVTIAEGNGQQTPDTIHA